MRDLRMTRRSYRTGIARHTRVADPRMFLGKLTAYVVLQVVVTLMESYTKSLTCGVVRSFYLQSIKVYWVAARAEFVWMRISVILCGRSQTSRGQIQRKRRTRHEVIDAV